MDRNVRRVAKMKALPEKDEGLNRASGALMKSGFRGNWNEFRFRPPFGNQTIIQPSLPAQRLKALSP